MSEKCWTEQVFRIGTRFETRLRTTLVIGRRNRPLVIGRRNLIQMSFNRSYQGWNEVEMRLVVKEELIVLTNGNGSEIIKLDFALYLPRVQNARSVDTTVLAKDGQDQLSHPNLLR